jgi:hypothetical protein
MKRLAAVFVVAVLYSFAASRMPYGEWDAWARWNMMARQLHYHEPVSLIRELSPYTGHLEYPPLMYLVQAALIGVFGDTPLVSIALHGAVLLAITALMRPYWLALIVGMACVYYAAIQYADLPLALCFLCAGVAYTHRRETWVGVALGLGALCKNEGALILAVFVVLDVLHRRRVPFRLLSGALVPILLLILWKLWIPESNDVLGSGGILSRVTDWQRYALIIPYVLRGLVSWSTGAVLIVVAIALLRGGNAADRWLLLVVAVVWAGYVAIYVITPYDVQWHLDTSYDRLIAQLFPVAAWAMFNRQTQTPVV